MTTVYLSQTSLVCAVLSELDRQYPGICVNQHAMNAIIAAANAIVSAQHGLTVPDTDDEENAP